MKVIHQIISYLYSKRILSDAQFYLLQAAGFLPSNNEQEWDLYYDEINYEELRREDEEFEDIYDAFEKKRPRHKAKYWHGRKFTRY